MFDLQVASYAVVFRGVVLPSSPQTPAYPSSTFLFHCLLVRQSNQSPLRHCLSMCNQISRYNVHFCIIFLTIVFFQRRGCFLCDAFIPSSFEKVRIFWQSAVNLACLIKFIVSEDFSASQTDGAMQCEGKYVTSTTWKGKELDGKGPNEMINW